MVDKIKIKAFMLEDFKSSKDHLQESSIDMIRLLQTSESFPKR